MAAPAPSLGVKPGGIKPARKEARRLMRQKTVAVGGVELACDVAEHAGRSETREIEVEVVLRRYKLADIDTGRPGSFTQPLRRVETGRVLVAGDIETAPRRGRIEGRGGWPRARR